MSEYIKRLIGQGEHQQQDFKFEINDSKRIARTLSAFCNTDGGRLLIGVKDNGVVKGVSSDEELYMIEASAKLYCRPTVDFKVDAYNVSGKTVLLVQVDKYTDQLVKAVDENGKYMVYLRRGDEVIKANYIYVKADFLRRKKQIKIKYTENEKNILKILERDNEATLSRLIKMSELNKRRVTDILIKFVAIDIVGIKFAREKIIYFLIDTDKVFLTS
jgi:predicted HTH transcriptional regulator